MKPWILTTALLFLASCASGPSVDPIDNALLASISPEGRESVSEARSARDRAQDAHAQAVRRTSVAEGRTELARAAVNTARARLDETKLGVELAKRGSSVELEAAKARHTRALLEADYAREFLALRKREHELAGAQERLALEEERLSVAMVELRKAEALQGVDLMAARAIPLKDYSKQVAYHRDEVKDAREPIQEAEADVDAARAQVAAAERKLSATAGARE